MRVLSGLSRITTIWWSSIILTWGKLHRNNASFRLTSTSRRSNSANSSGTVLARLIASYYFEGHQWALPVDAAAQVAGYRADLLEANGFKVPQTWEEVLSLTKFRRGFVTPALSPLDSLMCFFTMCANLGEPPFTSTEKLVTNEIGQQALERLRVLAENSFEGALSANPIAIWERMSSSDEIAYCPLAFGYSNYARNGYRSKLVSFGLIPSSGKGPVGATLGGAGVAISASCRHSTRRLNTFSGLLGKIANELCMSNLEDSPPVRRPGWTLMPRINQWLFRGDSSRAGERMVASTFFWFSNIFKSRH